MSMKDATETGSPGTDGNDPAPATPRGLGAWLQRLMLGPDETIATSPQLRAQFAQVEAAGVSLAFWVRAAAMAAVSGWIALRTPTMAAIYYIAIALVIVLSGLVQARLAKSPTPRRNLWRFGLIVFDCALITLAIMAPNPSMAPDWPIAMQLRLGNFGFLLIVLLLSGLTFSPYTVLVTGVALVSTWSIGIAVILGLPETFTVPPESFYAIGETGLILPVLLDPNYISTDLWAQQVVLATILTLILATIAIRSRRLASRQVRLAHERANLSRYFSPNLVHQLAMSGEDVSPPSQHQAAVLFVDLVGFTRLCEQLSPADTLRLLQSYYRRTADTVFDHNGTLSKYIGDAVMATFGIFEPDGKAATRALDCALALVDSTDRWNAKRQESGRFPIAIGIGLHYGDVLVGDVGDVRCREFAVLGTTVNTAARVERETRRLDRRLVITEPMATAVRAEDGSDRLDRLDRFEDLGIHALRGREDPVRLFGTRPLVTPAVAPGLIDHS